MVRILFCIVKFLYTAQFRLWKINSTRGFGLFGFGLIFPFFNASIEKLRFSNQTQLILNFLFLKQLNKPIKVLTISIKLEKNFYYTIFLHCLK